jgi:hypothetical protein
MPMYESDFVPWLYDGKPRQKKKDKLPTITEGKDKGQGEISEPVVGIILGKKLAVSDKVPNFTDSKNKTSFSFGKRELAKKKRKKDRRKKELGTDSEKYLMRSTGVLGGFSNPYDSYLTGG